MKKNQKATDPNHSLFVLVFIFVSLVSSSSAESSNYSRLLVDCSPVTQCRTNGSSTLVRFNFIIRKVLTPPPRCAPSSVQTYGPMPVCGLPLLFLLLPEFVSQGSLHDWSYTNFCILIITAIIKQA